MLVLKLSSDKKHEWGPNLRAVTLKLFRHPESDLEGASVVFGRVVVVNAYSSDDFLSRQLYKVQLRDEFI